jgi:ABC-type polysaccharide/polyol phosphate transport system ATPase subunit
MTKTIEIKKLGKKYTIFHEKGALVRDIPLWVLGIKKYEVLWALKGIDLEVNAGECLGIIGENGSGKSTLLNILSGITFPTQGSVKLNGKISAILSLGAGFHPGLTGEENIYLNASILGLGLREAKERFKEIVEFSELRDFIDVPLRTYSTGMYMRLGFSVAIHTDFDILLIDEIISVGDEEAQQKCIKKIFELKESGKTIVLVSHNMNIISELCNRVILLERGKIIKEDLPQKVIPYYLETVEDKKAKHQLLLKQQEEAAPLRASRTISSGNLRLFADLKGKSLRLYYKDKELTKGNGLHSLFYTSKKWFYLNEGEWQIQKVSEEELILTLNYESLSLLQVLTLFYRDENTLEIKVEIEVNKPISLDSWIVGLWLQDKYETWLTTYEGGDFSVNQYINNIAPVRLKESRISKIILKSGTNNHIPPLFFESTSYHDKQIFGIYKRNEENEEYICLKFSRIIPKKEKVVNPGRYTYFTGKIVLDKEPELKEESLSERGLKLRQGNLRFIFDQGRGRIFFKEKELTIGLGIYTSVRSSGIWYDSCQAIWQTDQKDDNKIVLLGDLPYIPISQIWQIELIDENSILWKVDVEIYEELNLEIEQANLMLSSEYKTWLISGIAKGELIDEFTQDYDILPFRFWYGISGKQGIMATSDILPNINFICNLKGESIRGLIENTDYFYKARLLQYQKSNTIKLLPKKYTYFTGKIKIEPKE